MPTWEAQNEKRLLLCLVDHNATPDRKLVGSRMGEDYTSEAVRSVSHQSLMLFQATSYRPLLPFIVCYHWHVPPFSQIFTAIA